MTSDRHGHVFVEGVEASSFSLDHTIPNSFYFVHRICYFLLQAMGTPREIIHNTMTNRAIVAANRFVGEVAVALGMYFGMV